MSLQTNTWSFTKISTWLLCPRKYQFRYQSDAAPEFRPAAIVLGSAVHEAAAFVHRGIQQGTVPDEAEVLAAFHRALQDQQEEAAILEIPLEYKTGEDFALLAAQGEQLVKTLLAAANRTGTVLGVEQSFTVPAGRDRLLTGVFDLVVSDGTTVTVVDVKTSAASYGADKLQHDLQAAAYWFAARRLFKGPVAFRFDVLVKTKQPTLKRYPVALGPRDEEEFLELIDDVDRAVTAGVFPRNRGWQCAGCEFRGACSGGS